MWNLKPPQIPRNRWLPGVKRERKWERSRSEDIHLQLEGMSTFKDLMHNMKIIQNYTL
jgi:hypothetical protein